MDKFHNLLRLLSNEVVHRAIAMVGEDILREPLEVYKGDLIFKQNSCVWIIEYITGEPLSIADWRYQNFKVEFNYMYVSL